MSVRGTLRVRRSSSEAICSFQRVTMEKNEHFHRGAIASSPTYCLTPCLLDMGASRICYR
uniref:SFRICE_036622 n=1 Tax=Spodoptera frugiperda TaxID=7108 RepID=A0A2H1VFW8_SPOFR